MDLSCPLSTSDFTLAFVVFLKHCVLQRFTVVDQGLEGLGFKLNFMIGLDDSLLTIIDGYFVGLLIYAG